MPTRLLRKKLDDAGVAAHLRELVDTVQALEVRVKGGDTARSEQATTDLHDAARRLREGEIAAIQIRFAIDGVWWVDTVMRARGSYRLVRMREYGQD